MLLLNIFINNIQKSKKKLAGTIGFEEKNNALNMWIQSEQKCVIFSKKFKQQCKSLQLFLVKDNLYHIRNRFDDEKTLFDSIYPVFLPRPLLTNLIILEAHRKVAYAGIDATLTEISSRYWISRVRQIIKHLLRNCVDCKREHKKPLIGPPPPKLPSFRLSQTYPFENTGLYYAGPLFVKPIFDNPYNKTYKVYILLFTYATTRNIHLELSPSMDTNSLIRAIIRFCSRRGEVRLYISDNFQTFKSSDLELYLTLHNIKWKFILAASPWWGGFYERMVKVVKTSLHKVFGKSKLSYEEPETVLIQIESIVNSRLLTFITTEEVCEPLTPSHLIYAKRLMLEINNEYIDVTTFDISSEQCSNRVKCIKNC